MSHDNRNVVPSRPPPEPARPAAGSVARMEVTKLEHACQILSDGDARLVLDPGDFTRPVDATGVVAVVVTAITGAAATVT